MAGCRSEFRGGDRRHLLIARHITISGRSMQSRRKPQLYGRRSSAAPPFIAVVPPEVQAEPTERNSTKRTRLGTNLLDRLLYWGVLPRYAFPTDVATFYVFDKNKSTRFRPEYRFSPSQGLSVALSQYAPGKEVWIAGKQYVSGAIYSPIPKERAKAWQSKRLYYSAASADSRGRPS